MTLEEKAAQLLCPEGFPVENLFSRGPVFHPGRMKEAFPDGVGVLAGIGRVSGGLGPEQTAFTVNEIQTWCREETRLGIPVLVLEEGTRGTRSPGSTRFPSPQGIASSWDPDLAERVWGAAAAEARCRGITLLTLPVFDLFGEDPYLCSRLGLAALKGIQGGGQPMLAAPGPFGEAAGLELLLTESPGLPVIQPGQGDWNGLPLHTGRGEPFRWLRDQRHFSGILLSAPEGIRSLSRSTGRTTEAVLAAANGGISLDRGAALDYRMLPSLVRSGALSVTVLDALVRPVLKTKFLLGLFENPLADPEEVTRTVGIPEHSALSREAAVKSFVLLENRRNFLPLDPENLGSIAVIGPGAGVDSPGNTAGQSPYQITVLKGIRDFSRGRFRVVSAQGCRLGEDPADWQLMDEAETIAARAEVILLVLAGNPEGGPLPGRQALLYEKITDLGVPVIVMILAETPPDLPEPAGSTVALYLGWDPGQETGRAAARLLFGEENPSARLPVTVGRWPFGFGLSHTTFRWSKVRHENGILSLEVTNTGRRRGTETVQLYLTRRSVTRVWPKRELAGFQQVTLEPGESRTVSFFTGRWIPLIPPDGELWLLPARNSADSLYRIPLKPFH
jgi:beta-glucosidase